MQPRKQGERKGGREGGRGGAIGLDSRNVKFVLKTTNVITEAQPTYGNNGLEKKEMLGKLVSRPCLIADFLWIGLGWPWNVLRFRYF